MRGSARGADDSGFVDGAAFADEGGGGFAEAAGLAGAFGDDGVVDGDFDDAAGFAAGFVGFCGRLLFADFPLAIGSFFFSARVEATSTATPGRMGGALRLAALAQSTTQEVAAR